MSIWYKLKPIFCKGAGKGQFIIVIELKVKHLPNEISVLSAGN
jgi:hypothetical protein